MKSFCIGPPSEARDLPTIGAGRWDHDVLASLECPRSVLVAAGWRVTLYSEPGFSGTVVEHTGDGGEAALSLREPPVSLIVEPPVLAESATVFERAGFGGRWQVLTPGRYRVDRLTLAVSGIRSIRLPAGWRAVLDRGPEGNGAVCDASVPDLDVWRAGAPIQGFEILAPGCGLLGHLSRVRLIGDHSGLPLRVAAGPNAPVQLGPPAAHMYFIVHARDDGWFSFAGLSVASHEPGASLCAAPAPDERALFRWFPLEDGTVAIQSRAGLVLDVCGAGRVPGTPIVQWYPHLGRNQRFDLTQAPSMA